MDTTEPVSPEKPVLDRHASVDGEEVILSFHCPGCGCGHGYRIKGKDGPVWSWNGSMTKPTFTPSLLVTQHEHVPPVTSENLEQWKAQPWAQTEVKKICHLFLTDGVVQFLEDCHHDLKGTHYPLPPVDE